MMAEPAQRVAATDTAAAASGARAVAARPVAIETEELSKRFPEAFSFRRDRGPGTLAVDRVTLSLEEGEIVGMVGPNGAGKTTFIRMLSTMVLPSSGSARVGGFDVTRQDREVRRLVGVVSSNERSFYWRLTGRENLRFFADLHHLDARQASSWIDELVELLGLGDVVQRRFDQYSTGQKQRMAIVRGLLSRPKILLMDEPTKGVDPVGAAQLIELIKTKVRPLWHPTILVTSHNLAEIERLCSRVALMHRGRMLALDTVAALKARVRKTDRYRLAINGLTVKEVEVLAHDAQGLCLGCERAEGELVRLEVSFTPGGGGFARLVRAIVEFGGDVVSATSPEESLEHAFHAILSEGADARGGGEGVCTQPWPVPFCGATSRSRSVIGRPSFSQSPFFRIRCSKVSNR